MTIPDKLEWYHDAFDSFLGIPQEADKRDKVISEGFHLPDIDGARSALERNYAVTNNTFSREALSESLKDLYLNSSHKLTASNTANVHFFRWEGYFDSWKRDGSTSWYQMTLPWDMFIYPEERDRFKLSRFYHRWITQEELMNNWDIFMWTIMMFVNRRVASNYEIWIEEQQVLIRVLAPENWISGNLPVYLYKFDTNFQSRVKVSYRELADHYRWQYPIDNVPDRRLAGQSKVLLTFNFVVSDTEPIPDRLISETLSGNLNFIELVHGTRLIDVGKIHPISSRYLLSRQNEQFWMGIISPKFLHEYPVLLPTDTIYRPWIPSMQPIMATKNGIPTRVKGDRDQPVTISDQQVPWVKHDEPNVTERLSREITVDQPPPVSIKQTYVSKHDYRGDDYDGWYNMIRPVVLSDAFRSQVEPYDLIREELDKFRFDLDNFIRATDDFPVYLRDDAAKSEENWIRWITVLDTYCRNVYDDSVTYFDSRRCPRDRELETTFEQCFEFLSYLREHTDFWETYSVLPQRWSTNVKWIIRRCYELIDRFIVADVIDRIPDKFLWDNPGEYDGRQRFNRPVDEDSFICFVYEPSEEVWRPTGRKFTRHFPDVYTIEPADVEPPRVYKAFFFYSDTPNVRETSTERRKSDIHYDEEMLAYVERRGEFRDIFIDRFYWLAINSLYDGSLVTGSHWEVIEHIIDNPSYRRFTDLFIGTVDPYFKLGLATYIRGSNFQFPFDDAIAKLEEQMSTKVHGFSRVTSFEHYLNRQWIPSYFDYLERMMDDYDPSNRLLRRPPLSFDVRQLSKKLQGAVDAIMAGGAQEALSQVTYATFQMDSAIHYQLNGETLTSFSSSLNDSITGLYSILTYLGDLDPEIMSIDDILRVADWLSGYESAIVDLDRDRQQLHDYILSMKVYDQKTTLVSLISGIVDEEFIGNLRTMISCIYQFKIEELNRRINSNPFNLEPDISSLIYQLSNRDHLWNEDIRELRTQIYQKTFDLNTYFIPGKILSEENASTLFSEFSNLLSTLQSLRHEICAFWQRSEMEQDQELLYLMNSNIEFISDRVNTYVTYMDARTKLTHGLQLISDYITSIPSNRISGTEKKFKALLIKIPGDLLEVVSTFGGRVDESWFNHLIGELNLAIDRWLDFLGLEKIYFDRLIKLTELPSPYVNAMMEQVPVIVSTEKYIRLISVPRTPEPRPGYDMVYLATDLEIVEVDLPCDPPETLSPCEKVHIPDVGTWILNISDLSGYKTYTQTFCNPIKGEPYLIGPSDHWVSMTVRCTGATSYPVSDYIDVNSVGTELRLIAEDILHSSIDQFQPTSTVEIDRISSVNDRWKHFISEHSHISYLVQHTVSSILEELDLLVSCGSEMNSEVLESHWKDLCEKIDYVENIAGIYRIDATYVSQPGEDYHIGDLVRAFTNGEHGVSDYLFQVTSTDGGKVTSVQPFMDYALTGPLEHHDTLAASSGCKGYGLKITVITSKVYPPDSDNHMSPPPEHGDTDLMSFKFENIHDLDINYEVFIGGKQFTTFQLRHGDSDDPLHPGKIDVIYLPANMVSDLKNSSVTMSGDNHATYRLDGITVVEPGAGYHLNQEVLVDTGEVCLRLNVDRLTDTPFKGIAEVHPLNPMDSYDGTDPGGTYLETVPSSMNNIDDEFNDSGFNATFMYPSVEPGSDYDDSGIIYQGHRIDNSQVPMWDETYNGIVDVQEVTNPMIPDVLRQPPLQPPRGEYQLIRKCRLHRSDEPIIRLLPDLEVSSVSDLPRSPDQWSGGTIGSRVVVESDVTREGHRYLYTVLKVTSTGAFCYDTGITYDTSWNHFDVNWMDTDWYPDLISRSDVHLNSTTYISDLTISDLSVFNWTTKVWEDLSDDDRWRLEVRENPGDRDYGFRLTFLGDNHGDPNDRYSYDMMLYLNKVSDNQSRNISLIKQSSISVRSSVIDQRETLPGHQSVMTGRTVRIRKLFPYEQVERHTFHDGELQVLCQQVEYYRLKGIRDIHSVVATPDKLEHKGGSSSISVELRKYLKEGKGISFSRNQYMHFRNEIHLEDVKIFNQVTGKFENILDPTRWVVYFLDSERSEDHREIRTNFSEAVITKVGSDYLSGPGWGRNGDNDSHVFGWLLADDGKLVRFNPMHFVNQPSDGTLSFEIYQGYIGRHGSVGRVSIHFRTETVDVIDDGYIHRVTNPMAPISEEMKLIPIGELGQTEEFDFQVSLTPRSFSFFDSHWVIRPSLDIPNWQCQADRWYVLVNGIRYPIINQSTGLPTLKVVEHETGTTVTFMNIHRAYEQLEFRTLPYPIRSVYSLRHIPQHGFINLDGKLNKPLSRRYYEFWVNGKLLDDEVTIVSPVKLFLHGLTSLRNLEIVEVNRDPHEYFADTFLRSEFTSDGIPSLHYDYRTYLDGAIDGKRLGDQGDIYSDQEREQLLYPVWKQVDRDHREYKFYPENCNVDRDILLRLFPGDLPLPDYLSDDLYGLAILDIPTIEGVSVSGRDMTFGDFNFVPISDQQIIDMLNEEWSQEIADDPYLDRHYLVGPDQWYGATIKMYDEFGIRVHDLNSACYTVHDDTILGINTSTKQTTIIQ